MFQSLAVVHGESDFNFDACGSGGSYVADHPVYTRTLSHLDTALYCCTFILQIKFQLLSSCCLVYMSLHSVIYCMKFLFVLVWTYG